MKKTNLLLSADGADGGASAGVIDLAALQKENADLKEQLAAVKKPGALTPEQEKIVREKVRAGLTREQAIAVLQAQEEWDEEQECQADEAAARTAKELRAAAAKLKQQQQDPK